MGRSTRKIGRRVIDFASDAEDVLDALEVTQCVAVGRSGGGPHALACAAYPPLFKRIAAVATVGSPCPRDQRMGDAWFEGMSPGNVELFNSTPQVLHATYKRLRRLLIDNREALLQGLDISMHESDRAILADPGWREAISTGQFDGLLDGPGGWVDDTIAVRSAWGFDPLVDVLCVRLHIHGDSDPFVPVQHATRYYGSTAVLPVMNLPDKSLPLDKAIMTALERVQKHRDSDNPYHRIDDGAVAILPSSSHFESFASLTSIAHALIQYKDIAFSMWKEISQPQQPMPSRPLDNDAELRTFLAHSRQHQETAARDYETSWRPPTNNLHSVIAGDPPSLT